MTAVHTWNGASGIYLYDPSRYVDGTPFNPGDTLIVSSGDPSAASAGSSVAPLKSGTYQFTPPAGGVAGLDTTNIDIDPYTVFAASGAGTFQWFIVGQLVNDGAIDVGSAAASGTLQASLSTLNPVVLTNRGTIDVQNNSLFRLKPSTATGSVVNAAGGTIITGGGGTLSMSSYYGYSAGGSGNVNTTNNGVIDITGTAGRPPGAAPVPTLRAATAGAACSPSVERQERQRRPRRRTLPDRPAARSTSPAGCLSSRPFRSPAPSISSTATPSW